MLCLSHLRQVQLPSGAPGANDQVLGEEEALPLPLLPQGQGAQPSTRHLPLLRHRHLDEGPCGRRGTAVTALGPGDTGSSPAAHKDSRSGWQHGVGTLHSPTPAQGLPEGVCRDGAEKNGTENLPGLPGWQHQAGFLSEESYSIPNVALGSLFPVIHPFKVTGGHGYRQPMKGTGPFLNGRGSFFTLITLVLNLPALNFSGEAPELSEKEELLSPLRAPSGAALSWRISSS